MQNYTPIPVIHSNQTPVTNNLYINMNSNYINTINQKVRPTKQRNAILKSGQPVRESNSSLSR